MKLASTPAPTGNRFERRRQRTRSELVTAATRVLARKGFHETKVTDIAAAADVGVGTFYLHFRDKEAPFHAVVARTAARMTANDEAARERSDGSVDQALAHHAASR